MAGRGSGNLRILIAVVRANARRVVDKDKCRKRKKITYYERWRAPRPAAREIFKSPINIPFILLLSRRWI